MIALWSMINSIETPSKEHVKAIEKKLELCRNQYNNPDSQSYKRALDEQMNDETVTYEKYAKFCEEQERIDQRLIETTGLSSRRSQ
jgi:hypothetical protein